MAALLVFSAPASAYVVMGCTPGERGNIADDEWGWKPDCGGVFNLCGYVDRSGKQVVPRRSEVELSFSENMAAVRIDGKFGFIDRTGTVIIPPKFDLAGPMSGGHAEILVGDRVGVVSKSGEVVAQPNFARAFPFGSDKALVLEGSFKSRGITGCDSLTRIQTNQLDDLVSGNPSSYRVLDLKNGQLSDQSYHIKVFDKLSRGLVWAKPIMKGKYTLFGLLRPDETWRIEPHYEQVGTLRNGYAAVCGGPDDVRDGQLKCGAVDRDGNLVRKMRFPSNTEWYDELALIRVEGKVGVTDNEGNLIGGRYFDLRKTDGAYRVVQIKGKWFDLDSNGRLVAESEDRDLVARCSNGLMVRRQAGKYVFISEKGERKEPHLFDDIYPKRDCSGPVGTKLGEVWGFVGQDGRLLGGPPRFNTFYPFANGYAVVSLDHQWGIIDIHGAFSVAPKYDRLRPDDDAFLATLNGEEFWIDAKGNRVTGPSRKEDRAAVLNCRKDGGRLIFDESSGDALWGLADETGKIVIGPKYRAMRCFQNGLAWVADDKRRKWCQIDQQGVVRDEDRCSAGFNGVVIADAAREKFSDDPYESLVLWERALLDYGRGVEKLPPRIVGDFGRF